MQPGDESINSIRLRLPIPLKNETLGPTSKFLSTNKLNTSDEFKPCNLIKRWDIRRGDSSYSAVICLTSGTSIRVASHPAINIINPKTSWNRIKMVQ